MERRNFTVTELRAVGGEDKPPVISGYAAVFGSVSEDLGGFVETFTPGAFSETIQNDDIRVLFNHKTELVLGRTTNGTLTLAEDERGLRFEVTLPDTSYARDVLALIKRGEVNQMSFGFKADDDEWRTENGQTLRIVRKAKLFEVSPVTFPAYQETSAEARAMAEQLTAADRRATAADAVDDSPVGRPVGLLKNKLKLWEIE